jgi:mono/diheme cytochrome c family protein
MKTISLSLALAALVAAAAVSAWAQEGGGPPPARSIPGITAPDPFPGGCVDCHVVREDIGRDVRISTILKAWAEGVEPEAFLEKAQMAAPEGVTLKGKHPQADWAFADIPGKCMTCHAADSKTVPPLGRIMHLYHLSGDANPYLSVFGGECTPCHKLDAKTGRWSMTSGPEK